MSALFRDLRLAARSLRARPGFTAVAALTLALGIGANAAIFSLVNGVVLSAVPWPNASTLVSVSELDLRDGGSGAQRGVSTAKYREWAAQLTSVEDTAAFTGWGANLTEGESAMLVDGARVTPNAFAVTGVKPALGRAFADDEARPGAEPVVMLSYGLWERRYAKDPDIVNSRIEIDGRATLVVGIFSEEQWFPQPWIDLVGPLAQPTEDASRTDHSLGVLARLAPGREVADVQAELELIAERLAAEYPDTDAGWGVRAQLMRDTITTGTARTGVWLMLGASLVLLAISCANVASLLLARASGRKREIVVRTAIGAGRGQLVRQLLSESFVLAAIGCVLALVFARWMIDFMLHFTPSFADYLYLFVRFDAALWVYAALVSLVTVVAFGLAPALAASRVDLQSGLKEGGERGATSAYGWVQGTLVVVQLGFSLALITMAGLLVERYQRLGAIDPGFDPDDLIASSVQLSPDRYPEPAQWRAFERTVRERVASQPGVEGIATASWAPFTFGAQRSRFTIPGEAVVDESPQVISTAVSEEYFATMRQRLVRGRLLDATDREDGLRVAVVNEVFARRFFREREAVGAELLLDGEDEPRRVVGVVADAYQLGFTQDPEPQIYAPSSQRPSAWIHLLVRGDPEATGPILRATLREMDRLAPLYLIETMEGRVADSSWTQLFFASVVTLIAGVALTLASVGLYGTVSYQTAQRDTEFGIRTALGATPGDIGGLVVRSASLLAGLGLVLGFVLSVLLWAGMSRALPAMPELDLIHLAAVAMVLATVTLSASLAPALRASRLDPMLPLRAE